jgi:hypothetical protein
MSACSYESSVAQGTMLAVERLTDRESVKSYVISLCLVVKPRVRVVLCSALHPSM